MYIVRFNRWDGEVEEYYYWNENEAREHIDGFKDDDSGLYRSIELRKET